MSPVYEHTLIDRIQQANDIVDVVAEHVSLKRKGREMVGLCPFHDDHSPSMNVSPHKQLFKCFACGAGGDVFKFLQMRENLTFPQAIERLAERASITVESSRPISSGRHSGGQSDPDAVDPNRLARANAWAAKFFEANLADDKLGESTRKYLAERNIGSDDAEKWRIGLAIDRPDALLVAAKRQSIPLDLLQKAGLIAGSGRDKFINRLMFPITDVTNRIIGFGGRTLANESAKYINSPATALFDKSNCLYGLNNARHEIVKSGAAIVVEGYTDTIMAHSKGVTNVVATLGTSFTTGHGRMLRRYANKAVLVFDGDTAGIAAANRGLEVALAQRIDIKVAVIPSGQDPCDFLLAHGKEGFDGLIAEAADVFAFKWARLEETFARDDTLAGRKAAIDEFLQSAATALAAGNLNPIETGLLVNRLARVIGIDGSTVAAELKTKTDRARRSNTRTVEDSGAPAPRLDNSLATRIQREIIEVLLCEPSLCPVAEKSAPVEEFENPQLRGIIKMIYEISRSGRAPTADVLLRQIESIEISKLLTGLDYAGRKKGNFQKRLEDVLAAFERIRQRKSGGGDHIEALKAISNEPRKANRYNMGMT